VEGAAGLARERRHLSGMLGEKHHKLAKTTVWRDMLAKTSAGAFLVTRERESHI
jgi:hypothetical protein